MSRELKDRLKDLVGGRAIHQPFPNPLRLAKGLSNNLYPKCVLPIYALFTENVDLHRSIAEGVALDVNSIHRARPDDWIPKRPALSQWHDPKETRLRKSGTSGQQQHQNHYRYAPEDRTSNPFIRDRFHCFIGLHLPVAYIIPRRVIRV